MSGVSFTNLHISPQGWFLTARTADGKMANYDLSRISAHNKGLVMDGLVALIRDPGATRTDRDPKGLD